MSTAFKQGFFLHPPDRKHIVEQSVVAHETEKRIRREANLYDAVAGRVSYRGFMKDGPFTSRNDNKSSTEDVAVTPEEVLFRRKDAPLRTEEDDFYWAEKHIPPSQKLPDSDLLKTLHTFTADFYTQATDNQGKTDSRSMDETALLALGILMEESAAQVLGETGDLVFVQGNSIDNQGNGPESGHSTRETRSHTRSRSRSSTVERKRKRLKLEDADNIDDV